jgi:hypothetical protein
VNAARTVRSAGLRHAGTRLAIPMARKYACPPPRQTLHDRALEHSSSPVPLGIVLEN